MSRNPNLESGNNIGILHENLSNVINVNNAHLFVQQILTLY